MQRPWLGGHCRDSLGQGERWGETRGKEMEAEEEETKKPDEEVEWKIDLRRLPNARKRENFLR